MSIIILYFISATFALTPGLYHPSNGNNDSICPQEVRTVITDNQLTALKVVYVGDCYYWGPFEYPCQESTCTDGNIFFEITSKRSYRWLNTQYDIHADFTP
jgi:hypothetical protein